MTRVRVLLILAIVFSLSGCAQSPDCLQEDIFCAALVTDTRGLNDLGPNQNAWAGLQNSHAEGITDQVAYIESVDAKDYEKNIAFFVEAGYDVIVTSSIGLQNATLRQADLQPATVFIGMLQTDAEARPNFIPVTFPEDQMGFLAGALAARLTETGIVGAVCETSGIDSMWRYCEGFSAGVKYVDSSVETLVEYRDDGSRDQLFIDPDWGAEAAQGVIHSGADVVFAAGGETAAGALRAASTAGVRVIGAERDQAIALAESGLGVVTSVVGQTSFTVQELMRRIKDGDVADAELGPVMFISLDGRVTPELASAAAEWLKELENGEIMTNVTKKKP